MIQAMEDSMLHRQALMEAKLEVEKYRKQESMMQEDLIFLRKDLSTASESKKIIQGQLNASELVVAELRVNCHSAQEENRTLKSKISMLIQEIDDYTKRLKELDQQNYFLTQDKV